jgi:hypothetical protein
MFRRPGKRMRINELQITRVFNDEHKLTTILIGGGFDTPVLESEFEGIPELNWTKFGFSDFGVRLIRMI